MKPKSKKGLLLLASTAVFIFIIFKTIVGFGDFLAVVREVKVSFLVLAMVIGFSGPFLSTLRWQMVLALNGSHTKFAKIFSVIMATWPLSLLPARAGDFARSYPLLREIKPSVSIAATIFEKIIDVSLLLLISSFGFFYLKLYPYGLFLLLLGLSLVPLVFLAKTILRYLPEFIAKKLQAMFVTFRFADLKSQFFGFALGASLLNWLASIAEVWLLFAAFGADVGVTDIAAYLPLAIFIGLLPITIAGIGTRDAAMVAFFLSKAAPAQSLAAGIGYTFIGYILFAIIGIPFFLKEFKSLASDNDVVHPTP